MALTTLLLRPQDSPWARLCWGWSSDWAWWAWARIRNRTKTGLGLGLVIDPSCSVENTTDTETKCLPHKAMLQLDVGCAAICPTRPGLSAHKPPAYRPPSPPALVPSPPQPEPIQACCLLSVASPPSGWSTTQDVTRDDSCVLHIQSSE